MFDENMRVIWSRVRGLWGKGCKSRSWAKTTWREFVEKNFI